MKIAPVKEPKSASPRNSIGRKKKSSKEKVIAEAPSDKVGAISDLISEMDSSFGTGSVMRMGDTSNVKVVGVISTGAIGLDWALGVGGCPKGRIIEIFGPESSGKSTLALHILAEAQKKRNGTAAFIDVEHAMDIEYAARLGIKTGELLFSQPDFAEQALNIVEYMVRKNVVDAIVVDSVSALVPKAEVEGEVGDSHMGLQARIMSQALRKLTPIVHRSNTCLIFVNQIRNKIGVIYGSNETTSGGNALKFYASQRMDVRKISSIKAGELIIGNRVRVKVVKNKVAPPYRSCELDIIFGEGVDCIGSLLDAAVEVCVVNKSGAWYDYQGERIGQGRVGTSAYLRENMQMYKAIRKAVKKELFAVTPIERTDEVITDDGSTEPEDSESMDAGSVGLEDFESMDDGSIVEEAKRKL